MALASDRPAVGQSQVSLRSFQSLDARLLIHAKNDGVFRRVQIEPDDLRGLWRELWVGTYAPAPTPLELDTVTPQGTPHLVSGNIFQCSSQKSPVPGAKTLGRRLIQFGKDASFCFRTILSPPASSLVILKRGDATPSEAHPPRTHRVQANTLTPRDAGRAFSFGCCQDNAGAESQPLLSPWRAQPALKFTTFFIGKDHRRCYSTHAASILHPALIFSSKY
jgi:hypothetical protein